MNHKTKHLVLGFASSIAGLGLFIVPLDAAAQGHGGGEGGGGQATGCGDVFGDLVHVKRETATGQAILQKRWIEYPGDVYDWGYCPIAIDENGQEIDFIPLTCDPADPTAVVEVDYFGRLSAGRTKERNLRMHFDEVIVGIKEAQRVRQDEAGRLELGTECSTNPDGTVRCASWKTVDSPLENLGLYTRLMRYGHIQTDPAEVDIWAHGDPALGDQYHPALDSTDYPKFVGAVRHLLPGSSDPEDRAEVCFPAAGFNPACALPRTVGNRDFIRSSSFLGAAAGKEGKITLDLVQYMNRILAITRDTEASLATLRVLPALIRDCGDDPDAQLPVEQCTIVPATPDLPWPANELFVDFGRVSYDRIQWRDRIVPLIRPVTVTTFVKSRIALIPWLEFANGPTPATDVMEAPGFVSAASDGLRLVQLVHEYAPPADLGWSFQ